MGISTLFCLWFRKTSSRLEITLKIRSKVKGKFWNAFAVGCISPEAATAGISSAMLSRKHQKAFGSHAFSFMPPEPVTRPFAVICSYQTRETHFSVLYLCLCTSCGAFPNPDSIISQCASNGFVVLGVVTPRPHKNQIGTMAKVA